MRLAEVAAMRQLLESGMAVELVAHGWSMFPTLRPGCRLRFQRCNDLRPGLVVVYLPNKTANEESVTLVAHRLVRCDKSTAICRGDSCLTPDEPINKDHILGVVCGCSRTYGRVILALAPLSYAAFHLLARLAQRLTRNTQKD